MKGIFFSINPYFCSKSRFIQVLKGLKWKNRFAVNMKKNFGLGIFMLIHLYYSFRLVAHGANPFAVSLFMLAVAFAYIWGFDHYPHNRSVDAAKIPSSVISATLGGICCYGLSIKTGPILACGAVGYAASFLTHLFKDEKFHELPYSTYCGCFVGMSSQSILPHFGIVALLAGISGLLFATTKRSLEGVGGKLGSIAFVAVVSYLLIKTYI